MKWNRFTIKTKTEAEDVIISALADVGVEGVEIQDKRLLPRQIKSRCLWILCRKVQRMMESPI